MIGAAVAPIRQTFAPGLLPGIEATRAVAVRAYSTGSAAEPLLAIDDAAVVEGGVVAIEVLGPAAGMAVAGATGPDGQGPAQGGPRRQAGG